MNVTFFSNYFNHHQEALCNALSERLQGSFTFVETEKMEEFRSKMGWERPAPSYVLKSYESEEAYKKAEALALESDLVIMGTAPESFIEKRLDEDKLIFRYSERPLKEGRIKVLIPRLAKKFYHNHFRNRNKNIHILAAGAYCASDYKFLHSYIGKCYKFGYFPEGEKKEWGELCKLKDENRPVKLLWAGRFLGLKRADLFINAAGELRKRGFEFTIEMVGNGEEEKRIKDLVRRNGLEDITEFKGFLSPEETREEMEKADIFVMTSNHLEGWGSVIYEALSAGCAVIASHAAGATPFLIEHGKTGLIFRSTDLPDLTGCLNDLLSHRERIRLYGEAAYRNMREYWNPGVAAERVIDKASAIINGRELKFENGPLSDCEYVYDGR